MARVARRRRNSIGLMMIIAQNAWEQSARFFNDGKIEELDAAKLYKTDTPRGFAIDESLLCENTRAKVRFHFVEKTGRLARGSAL